MEKTLFSRRCSRLRIEGGSTPDILASRRRLRLMCICKSYENLLRYDVQDRWEFNHIRFEGEYQNVVGYVIKEA